MRHMTEMNRAVILAAGLGTRLRWLTRNRPKALIAVAGEPAITHVIRSLASQGIRDIAINVHHHADQLVQVLGDGSRFGVRLYFSWEETLLDSGGGVRTAMELLPGDGLLTIHNTDVLTDVDVHALADRCPPLGCALGLVPNLAHHPEGDFSLQNGLISSVQDDASRYTFSGVSVWDQRVFDAWPSGMRFPLTEAIHRLTDAHRGAGVVHNGLWFDVGRPHDLIQARKYMHVLER